MIKKTAKRNRKPSYEYLKRIKDGTLLLQYDASEDEIPYDEFLDDIDACFDSRSSIVLKIADECCADEDDERRILARGGAAIDAFYDSLMTHWDDEENGVVGGFDPKYHEMTDFYHKLCDSRYLAESCRARGEARKHMRSRLNRRR